VAIHVTVVNSLGKEPGRAGGVEINRLGKIIAANGDCVTTPLSQSTIRLVATITT
jgi:hypothetical protein